MASTQIMNVTRGFSSSSAVSQLVKPPVQVFGLYGRYAGALYSAATKLKQLDVVEKDLAAIQNVITTDKKLGDFFDNPVIPRNLKMEAVGSMGTKLKLSTASTNLLALLAENGRLRKFESVSAAFSTIMAGHRGDLRCEVTTAKPLDADTKSQLEKVLKSFAKKGENVLLELKVNPALIGGMIVSIGDKYVDMSVASKIKKYTEIIQASV